MPQPIWPSADLTEQWGSRGPRDYDVVTDGECPPNLSAILRLRQPVAKMTFKSAFACSEKARRPILKFCLAQVMDPCPLNELTRDEGTSQWFRKVTVAVQWIAPRITIDL